MTAGTVVAAILTLAIFSFLYRENPFFRFAEHLLVGLSAGYFTVIAVQGTLVPKVIEPLKAGDFWVVISFVLIILILGRLTEKTRPASRIPLALVIGAGAGVAVPALLQARILVQLGATMKPLGSLANVLILIGVITTLIYFYFSREHKGWWGRLASVGTWYLMIFFGATFGNTVMSRISLLIGRLEFLFGDFLGLIK
ncbi:MAG TPA: hypothetical protein VFR89_01700 [candidate division Zixibacteria bacterium]|nr:hypothetical protein [candidate division Zixibacteria bacterium]